MAETSSQAPRGAATTVPRMIALALAVLVLAVLLLLLLRLCVLGDEPPIRVRNGSMNIELVQGQWDDSGDGWSPSTGWNWGTFEVKVTSANGHACSDGQAGTSCSSIRSAGSRSSRGGQLKGIFTESDIFKAFYGILTSTQGWIILFEEPAELADAQHDYAKPCLEHGCRVHTVLRYPTSSGSTMYYLCVAGAGVDAFVRKLWAMSNQVVLVE